MAVAPVIASKTPFQAKVEAGKSYWWCSCGKSSSQPLCDGSHKGSGFVPMEYKATADGDAWFCGCKHTKNAPMCDGSHNMI